MTTWNPSDKSANINLTNGNLMAAATTASDGAVRSNTNKPGSKYYFEATWASPTGGNTGIGVATAAAALTGLGPNAAGGAMVYQASGSVYFNGTSTGIAIAQSNPRTICVAIDLVNSRIWFRCNTGTWNNSGTANPATNVGGINIAALFPANAAYAACSFNSTVPTTTANFGATAFAFTVPSGFSGWDAAAQAAVWQQAVAMNMG